MKKLVVLDFFARKFSTEIFRGELVRDEISRGRNFSRLEISARNFSHMDFFAVGNFRNRIFSRIEIFRGRIFSHTEIFAINFAKNSKQLQF